MNRTCPSCGREQTFKSKLGFEKAVGRNSLCKSCSKTGERNPSFGIFPKLETRQKISQFHIGVAKSEEHKKKISLSHTGKHVGEKNEFFGKKHSEESKRKSSNAQIGIKSYKYGRPLSEETKRKMRRSVLEKLEKKGIAPCIDTGAPAFFEWMNRLGFNFHPKTFKEIGYVADGYDETRNIWCEFDTPHHKRLGQRNKDQFRQQRIINYFETNKAPLSAFLRINADKNGNVIDTKCVYKGGY